MKKHAFVSYFLVLSFVFIGFAGSSVNTANAANCAPGDLFNTVTGQRCATASIVQCPAGDLFSSVTGEPCTVYNKTDGSTSSTTPLSKFNDLFKPNFGVGVANEEVKVLQQFLKDEGYYFSKIDGKYGKITNQAVKDFKGKHNISKKISTKEARPSGSSTIGTLQFPVVILSPKEGETYKAGDVMNISWKINKNVKSEDTFRVSAGPQWHYTTTKGDQNILSSPVLPSDARSYSWTIPDPLPPHDPFPFRVVVGFCDAPAGGKPILVDGGYQSCENSYGSSVFNLNIIPSQTTPGCNANSVFSITTGRRCDGTDHVNPSPVVCTGQTCSPLGGSVGNTLPPVVCPVGQTCSPTTNSITVVSPNGRENYDPQISRQIKVEWNMNYQPTSSVLVMIMVLDDFGRYGSQVVSEMTNPTIGNNSWTVYSGTNWENGRKYKIQVCERESTTATDPICDYSDNIFTINSSTTQPSITVLSPNGGEKWQAGSTETIKWKASDFPANSNVYIELSPDRPGLSPTMEIAVVFSDRGNYDWRIPSTLIPGPYRIKLYQADEDENISGSAKDISDFSFTITSPTISTKPVITSMTPQKGSPSGTKGENDPKVTIYGSGFTQSSIVLIGDKVATMPPTYVSPDGTQLQFTFPADALLTGNWSVRVSNVGNVSVASGLASNYMMFTIISSTDTRPSITVVSPNGGELWQAGSTETIEWKASDFPANSTVYIELRPYRSGLSPTMKIAAVSSSIESYQWQIPSTIIPGPYRIEVYQGDKNGNVDQSASAKDISDAPFTINSSVPHACQSITINGTTYSLDPCTITETMVDGQGNKSFSTTIKGSGGYGVSVHGYGVGFPTYATLGFSSGGASGNAVINRYFNDAYLSSNGDQPKTYTGYLPIHIYQGSETGETENYLYLNLNLTVNPAPRPVPVPPVISNSLVSGMCIVPSTSYGEYAADVESGKVLLGGVEYEVPKAEGMYGVVGTQDFYALRFSTGSVAVNGVASGASAPSNSVKIGSVTQDVLGILRIKNINSACQNYERTDVVVVSS